MAETVTQTVADYVHAMTYADAGLLRQSFDPRAAITGTFEGATEWLPLEDFIDRIRAQEESPYPDEDAFEILGIDKQGNCASVKLVMRLRGAEYCDYLSLLHEAGDWTIVHRLFYLQG